MNLIEDKTLKKSMPQYDMIVVGSGFCGSVVARLAAEECGKRVLIIERRGHIAGNMYDALDENGILVQKYGVHIFHTNEEWVYQFISRFAEWFSYNVISCVDIDGKYVPSPFGFKAIRTLYSEQEAEELIFRLKKAYPGRDSVPVLDLLESSDKAISSFARLLYEKDYRPYSAKQWNLDPRNLDRSVLERLPIILSDREKYFDEDRLKYILLPEKGFTEFFDALLSHENIDILLGTNVFDIIRFDFERRCCKWGAEEISIPILYTGALEDFFKNARALPYRSLFFEYKTFDMDSFQPYLCVAFPLTHKYLRTIEYTKMMKQPPQGKTVVSFEYPVPYVKDAARGNEPYYPILTEENIAQNNGYLEKLSIFQNLYPCGRLADYKYYDMDDAIVRAFESFAQIREKYWR